MTLKKLFRIAKVNEDPMFLNFKATGVEVENINDFTNWACSDSFIVPGRMYTDPDVGIWFIEDRRAIGDGKGDWWTIMYNEDVTSDNLETVEKWLWERVKDFK